MNKRSHSTSNEEVDDDVDSLEVDRLVGLASQGDEEAFGQVVKLYYHRVYRVIYQVVRHAEDARELAQSAWVKAWRRLGNYRGDARFYTWIYRIAVNTALDFLRKRGRWKEVPLEPVVGEGGDQLVLERQRELADGSNPGDELQRKEVRQAFEKGLASLSPGHRAVLVLREVQGMSYDEIARVMKTRKGTVMSRLFYARKAMQTALGEHV